MPALASFLSLYTQIKQRERAQAEKEESDRNNRGGGGGGKPLVSAPPLPKTPEINLPSGGLWQ